MNVSADEPVIEPEDRERVNRLAREIIAPGLHKAVQEAQKEAPTNEVLSSMVNAYGAVLLEMIDRKAASALLHSYADHIGRFGAGDKE